MCNNNNYNKTFMYLKTNIVLKTQNLYFLTGLWLQDILTESNLLFFCPTQVPLLSLSSLVSLCTHTCHTCTHTHTHQIYIHTHSISSSTVGTSSTGVLTPCGNEKLEEHSSYEKTPPFPPPRSFYLCWVQAQASTNTRRMKEWMMATGRGGYWDWCSSVFRTESV